MILNPSLPKSFAILSDSRRRGGLRVARVVVRGAYEPLSAANVVEVATGTEHWLTLARLSRRPRHLGPKIRSLLSTAPALGLPAAAQSLAKGGAV